MTIICSTSDACTDAQVIIESYWNIYTCTWIGAANPWFCETENIRTRNPTISSINPTLTPSQIPTNNPTNNPTINPAPISETPTGNSVWERYLPLMIAVIALSCVIIGCLLVYIYIHHKILNKNTKEDVYNNVINSKAITEPSRTVISEPGTPVIVYNLSKQITQDTTDDFSIGTILQQNQLDRKNITSGRHITQGDFEYEYEHENEGIIEQKNNTNDGINIETKL